MNHIHKSIVVVGVYQKDFAKGGRNFRVVSHPLSRGLTFILFTFISVSFYLSCSGFPFYHFASVGLFLPISKVPSLRPRPPGVSNPLPLDWCRGTLPLSYGSQPECSAQLGGAAAVWDIRTDDSNIVIVMTLVLSVLLARL